MDKAFITIIYPPDSDTGQNKAGWSVEDALDRVGVSERKRRLIIESYKAGGYSKLREAFGDWRDESRGQSPRSPVDGVFTT